MKDYLRSFLTRETAGQFFRLSLIGGLNTLVYFALLNILRWGVHLSSFWSVTWAFVLATALSYVLNRRWTFKIKHGRGLVRETVWFYVVNLAAWGVTVVVVKVAERLFGELGPFALNAANIVATGFILIPKFASYRDLVFGKALRHQRRDNTPAE
ncbi:GtrA-like protein [bacterium BMS3Abin02]|nr:GtrA-like protein [bacterium BMS3Abin02]GBE21778.1 GtrA-like protein [bacterium BMS3Bbin01]